MGHPKLQLGNLTCSREECFMARTMTPKIFYLQQKFWNLKFQKLENYLRKFQYTVFAKVVHIYIKIIFPRMTVGEKLLITKKCNKENYKKDAKDARKNS